MMKALMLLVGALLATAAQAATVYKSVGADGKITYSDEPPVNARESKAMKIADGPVTPLPASVLKYRAELAKGARGRIDNVAGVANASGTTLFSANWCGYCKKAKAYLSAKGVAYRDVDIDSPDGAKAFFAAGGGGGVPLLLVDGQRVSGFSQASYDGMFAGKKQ
jgi:glutaredoxin